MKTVDQLEKNYRAQERAKGVKLKIIRINCNPYAETYCLEKQISRSEFIGRLIRKDWARRLAAIAAAKAKKAVVT